MEPTLSQPFDDHLNHARILESKKKFLRVIAILKWREILEYRPRRMVMGIGGMVVLLPLTLAMRQVHLNKMRPITKADAVLAVTTENWGLPSSGGSKLIMALWNDGYIVWSKDNLHGGPPYRAARIDAEKWQTLLTQLEQKGVFADKKLNRANFGPDSKFTTLYVKAGKRQLEMRSWHELYEEGGRTVAEASGLTGLEGRRLEDVLKEQPADYRKFRTVWKDIRTLASGLIPKSGTPVNDGVRKKAGILSWQETGQTP
jgi:hypothetical protein